MSPLKIRFKGNPLAAVVIVLALSWVSPEHLIIETADGKMIDRYTSMEVRMHQRIEPGDHVVEERGFGNQPHVPGKPTVSEVLEEHRRR